MDERTAEAMMNESPMPGSHARDEDSGMPRGKARASKSCWISAPAIHMLSLEAHFVARAFGATCYLVGSSLHRPTFRDVDVRMMLDDDVFVHLFGGGIPVGRHSMFWTLVCVSVSEYLTKRTGLPIDFQVQRQSEANELYGGERRMPLSTYPEEAQPGWSTGELKEVWRKIAAASGATEPSDGTEPETDAARRLREEGWQQDLETDPMESVLNPGAGTDRPKPPDGNRQRRGRTEAERDRRLRAMGPEEAMMREPEVTIDPTLRREGD